MLNVTFWGVRGSVPVSGAEFARYGGATTCLEISIDGAGDGTPDRVIIDCGTGVTELGKRWGDRAPRALILQTHFHWDHIQGFPFFAPLFNPRGEFALWSVEREGCGLRDVLVSQMTRPTFPIGIDILPAALTFDALPPQGARQLGDLTVRWAEVHHPSGCTAFRLDHRGASVVFSGDVEVQQGGRDALVTLARGADLLVMDAQYLPEEYPHRRGFGHSTPQDAVDVARAAGVRHLVMTHHDPTHTDDVLDRKLASARRIAGATLTVHNAREQGLATVEPGATSPFHTPHHCAEL